MLTESSLFSTTTQATAYQVLALATWPESRIHCAEVATSGLPWTNWTTLLDELCSCEADKIESDHWSTDNWFIFTKAAPDQGPEKRRYALLLDMNDTLSPSTADLTSNLLNMAMHSKILLAQRDRVLGKMLREQSLGYLLVRNGNIVEINGHAATLYHQFLHPQRQHFFDKIVAHTSEYDSGHKWQWSYDNPQTGFLISLHHLTLSSAKSEQLLIFQSWTRSLAQTAPAAFGTLSSREHEVALLLATTDKTPLEISKELEISVKTVRKHQENIYGKLAVHSRGELVALFNSL